MQTIRPSQVPEYLQTSDFYLNMNATDDSFFSIPSHHMKLDTNVDTVDDFTELLNTLRFWGTDVVPQSITDFAAQLPRSQIESILEPYRTELPFITAVCCMVAGVKHRKQRLEKAMESGNIDMVRHLHKKGVHFTTRGITLAAGNGALDCLQYALPVWNASRIDDHLVSNHFFLEAVRYGRMDSIRLLQQNGFQLYRGYMDDSNLTEWAAWFGQCEVLKYLQNEGCSIRHAAIYAADSGHWDCFEYAMEVEDGWLLRGETEYSGHLSLAQRLARADQLKLFPTALSRVGQIDAGTTLNFAKSEKWEMFKLCIQYIARPTLDIIFAATKQGYVDCLQRLHEVCVSEVVASGNGQNWLTYAASNGTGNSSSSANLRSVDLALLAAKAKQWDCLRFLITHACPMHKSLTSVLVYANQLELYHLAVEHGCEASVQAACYFTREGNLPLLQHALKHGCERSEKILKAAARHGRLPCLEYAHAQGCPWSAQVTLAAARGGHRECLQYLHEHGCPSNARARALKRKRAING